MNRSPRRLLVLWIATTLLGVPAARADLAGDIDAVLRDKSLARAVVGVSVVQLGDGTRSTTPLVDRNAHMPLIPASNLKLLTTSAALDKLGPDFRFQTKLVWHKGDLILVGDGDPSFGDAELLTRVNWNVTTVFQHWAERVKSLNLGQIQNVLVDDSIFDAGLFHPDWSDAQRSNRFEAEVAGMNLNVNCLDVFVRPTQPGRLVTCLTNPPAQFLHFRNLCLTGRGEPLLNRVGDGNDVMLKGKADVASTAPLSVTIHDPAVFAADVLAQSFTDAGLNHAGEIRRDNTVRAAMANDPAYQTLAIHETPLPRVMARANKDSVNLYGECLCKRLGAEVTGASGSWAGGTRAVGDFLLKAGVAADEFHLVDGCGLSRSNQVTPAAITKVLAYDFYSTNGKVFLDTLAVANTDGTLTDRFKGGRLKGRVLAKTGTINGVSCLSGFLHARDERWYAFSILINQSSAAVGKGVQEKIVAAIDGNVRTVADVGR